MLVTGSTFHAHSSEILYFGVKANHLFVFYESTRFMESKIPIGSELRKVVLYSQETFPNN